MDHQIFPSAHAQARSSAAVRRVERVSSKRSWVALQAIRQIRRGDVFRMFEPDGVPVASANGRTEFVAKNDATQIVVDGERRWAVEID